MSEGRSRGDAFDRAVRAIVAAVAECPSLDEADAALDIIRARIVEEIDDECDPDAAAILRRLLGVLIDETESGGRRR